MMKLICCEQETRNIGEWPVTLKGGHWSAPKPDGSMDVIDDGDVVAILERHHCLACDSYYAVHK
jgi:hypothetical protein